VNSPGHFNVNMNYSFMHNYIYRKCTAKQNTWTDSHVQVDKTTVAVHDLHYTVCSEKMYIFRGQYTYQQNSVISCCIQMQN